MAQGDESLSDDQGTSPLGPLSHPTADTLVYYMGRKDAKRIAMQLIKESPNHTGSTPVHILESVSTTRERHWSSNLAELANGKADHWLDSSSPALILIGQALQEKDTATNILHQHSDSASCKIDNGLQDRLVLAYSRRSA